MTTADSTPGADAGTSDDESTVRPVEDSPAVQELIAKYAPIAALKNQDSICDEDGEAYLPVAVDAVLNNLDVVLKQETSSSSETDSVFMTAPGAANLYGKGDGYYIDIPGDPRHPGCDFASWFAEMKDQLPPTAYAHVVASDGQLAVQYWLYYVFNDFNNKHESDWEMIQIIFDVSTPEEALLVEPVEVAFAQHGGGETANWTDSKLERDGTHPIVFVASGSHASQYGSATWLGWGENGTGFGCDVTTGPSTYVPLTAVLIPSQVTDPSSDFAWLGFEGRWGERKSWEYNGPTGPNTKSSWRDPFAWQTELRDSSIEVPGADTFGPAPTTVFCTLSAAGSNLLTRFGEHKWLFIGLCVGIIAIIAGLLKYTWSTLKLAARVYRRRFATFALIGIVLIPIGILFNGLLYLVSNNAPGSEMIALMDKSPGAYFALAILIGILQHLVSLVVIGPAVIETYGEMEQGRRLRLIDAYREVIRQFRHLLVPVLKGSAIIVGLALTAIGIPIAIWLLVKWLFIPQAVMLDNFRGDMARDQSETVVAGHWVDTALKAMVIAVVGAFPGVLVGLILLLQGSSVQATNFASSLIYAIVLPFSILGLTILYRQRQGKAITPLEYRGDEAETSVRESASGPRLQPQE